MCADKSLKKPKPASVTVMVLLKHHFCIIYNLIAKTCQKYRNSSQLLTVNKISQRMYDVSTNKSWF